MKGIVLAGAADGHDQHGLALLLIERQEEREHLLEL